MIHYTDSELIERCRIAENVLRESENKQARAAAEHMLRVGRDRLGTSLDERGSRRLRAAVKR